jgi:CBS domain-containing protein
MQVQEIMTNSVEIIDPATDIRDVALRMRADNLGAFPVGENGRLVGMITDRDIVVRAVARTGRPGDMSALLFRRG